MEDKNVSVMADSDNEIVLKSMRNAFGSDYLPNELWNAYLKLLLFRLRANRSNITDIPFNMTLPTNVKQEIVEHGNIIGNILDELTPDNNTVRYYEENDVFKADFVNKLQRCAVVYISVTSQMFFERLDEISKLFKITPHVSKILCLSKELEYILRNDHTSFYFQTIGDDLSYHPQKVTLNDDDIYDAFIFKIKEKGFIVSQSFCDEIRQYIETVYPKADLRQYDFIDDLIYRVIRKHLTRESVSNVIDERCVPYYNRNIAQSNEIIVPKVAENNVIAAESLKDDEEITELEKLDLPCNDITINEIDSSKCTEKNILLLSLSTFGGMTEATYTYSPNKNSENTIECKGIYQLDPVPKILSKVLSESNQHLDKIIMLATEATTKVCKRKVTFKDNNNNEISTNINTSPDMFFKYQVRNYLKPLDETKKHDLANDERFKIIKIDEYSPSIAIAETVNYIREEYNCNEGKVNLYIDAHGSLRGLSLAVLAINSLLHNENKGAKKIFSINTTEKSVFEDKNDKLFTYVSGLNEFRSFGRIDSLESFMAGKENKLTINMKMVADAISTCDINRFEKSMKGIKEYFNDSTRNTEVSSDRQNYLGIFEDFIKSDYGNLIENDSTVFDEIEWCHNKKLYQAALTIVESKVPEYVFGTDTKEARLPVIEFKNKNKIVQSWIDDERYGKGKNIKFASWLVNQLDRHFHKERIDFINDIIMKDENFIKQLIQLKKIRNQINHCGNDIPKARKIDEKLTEFLACYKVNLI